MIVDANVAHQFFACAADSEFFPAWKALLEKRARIVRGGRLTKEYAQMKKLARLLTELERQGMLRAEKDDVVDAAEAEVKGTGLCASDDPHIIGLAKVAKVRLLCSNDNDLITDFKNKRLLDSPRGSVYRQQKHKHLIARHCKDCYAS